MAVRPKLLIGAGIAFAGLGLIGAGAGATFTAQVAGGTSISTGSIALSLNGEPGSGLHLGVDGQNVDSHFAPITKDLLLKNTGTLDLASTYLSVTATGCDGGDGAPLAQALRVTLTEVTNSRQVYDGPLCSLVNSTSGPGSATRPSYAGVGGRLPNAPRAGASLLYRLVLQPSDAAQGLPLAAQEARTSVNLVFTGFDY